MPVSKNKKAQVSQVFIYVLAIIVFAFVLLYGYKAISKILQTQENVEIVRLEKDIISAIKKTGYKDVIIKGLDIPSKYLKVCFVDLSNEPTTSGSLKTRICDNSNNEEYNPVVCNSWKDKVKKNMFLVSDSVDVYSSYIGNISIGRKTGSSYEEDVNSDCNNNNNCYYFCANVNQGRIKIRIEGKGDHVFIANFKN